MPNKICCYTLFDITNTGILNRSKAPLDVNPKKWLFQRNTQCNFDTILQAISLRSQPEIISNPSYLLIKFDNFKNFGSNYKQNKQEKYPAWSFIFEVQHSSVFANDNDPLGFLYNDCNGIPMIKCGTEYNKLPEFLDTTDEFRNIYFEIL